MERSGREVLEAYLAAKGKMYGHEPGFRIERVGALRCIRNHPGWPERDAYYGIEIETSAALASIREDGSPSDHRLTLLAAKGEVPPGTGYERVDPPQPLLCRPLSDERYEGLRASKVADEAGVRQIDTRDLGPDVYRYYALEVEGQAVCRGRCVYVEDALYVTGLDTLPEFRRRGLGRALMRTMESDAAKRGKTFSVLWSTAMGLGLYRSLGYREPWKTEVYDFTGSDA